MSAEETDILHKIVLGDYTGLSQLFDKYYDSLCVYAMKYIDSIDVAEDIVQEVYIKFWENGCASNIKGSVRNYLMQAVKNNVLYYLRQNNRYQNISIAKSLDEVMAINESPEDLEEKKRVLYKEIERLSPQAKAVFEAIIFENMKYKEVAQELDISVNTVKTTFSRALKRLRSSIELSFLLCFWY